jgi:hypothetical protein
MYNKAVVIEIHPTNVMSLNEREMTPSSATKSLLKADLWSGS